MNMALQPKRPLWSLLSAILLVSVTACGTTGPTITPTPVNAATPTPDDQVPSRITIVIPEDPPSFNALVTDTGYDALVMNLVLLPLTAVNAENEVYPVLALELPTIENGGVVEDPETGAVDVTWKLRHDITWADGMPVTADDVIFTYEAMMDPANGTWFPGSDLVTSVEKVDDATFVVHFSSVYPSYLTLFGGRQVVIWPSHYCVADQGFQNWDCAMQPLSNGPYILKEWVRGDHLTFVKNPDFYLPGKPQIDEVIVRIAPNEMVRTTMLRQGDAEVLMWASEQVADELKSEPHLKTSISPTARFVMRLHFNLAAKGSTDPITDPNPFFSDVRVRQAIRSAIDVNSITSSVWYGYADPVWTEFFRPPHTCDIPRPIFDPEASKELLRQAGWTDIDGDGIRECNGCETAELGKEFRFELTTYSEYGQPLILTQQMIAEDLKEVGIQADLIQTQGSEMWGDWISGGTEQTGNFELDLYDDGYTGIDPTDFIWQYYHSDSADVDMGWNVGRWLNPEFDELLESAYTLSEADRQETFCALATILDEEIPQILLFSTINADVYSTRLSGIKSNVNSVVSWNVADWILSE